MCLVASGGSRCFETNGLSGEFSHSLISHSFVATYWSNHNLQENTNLFGEADIVTVALVIRINITLNQRTLN